jgi:large subunit ribosomal protein L4
METTIFNQAGKSAGVVTLPEHVFGVAWNPDLVHEVVVAMQGNARTGTAKVKDRSEVSGGGKKPWRQKGTGRARHGSRRSPIWVGGGVSHGPTNEKDYSRKLNKKVRKKALAVTLSRKHADGEIVFVEALAFNEPKTAEAKNMLKAVASGAEKGDLATKRKNAALVLLTERNDAVEKSFNNFGNIEVKSVKDVNPVDLLTYKYVVVVDPTKAVELLAARVAA